MLESQRPPVLSRPIKQSPRSAQRITKKGFFFSGLVVNKLLFLCHSLSFNGDAM